MRAKVFVPVTDEMLYERPEKITAPLRPFRAGLACFHEMAEAKKVTEVTEVTEREKLNARKTPRRAPARN